MCAAGWLSCGRRSIQSLLEELVRACALLGRGWLFLWQAQYSEPSGGAGAEGSEYCACHTKASQRRTRAHLLQKALCTAPATRKPAAAQRRARAHQLLHLGAAGSSLLDNLCARGRRWPAAGCRLAGAERPGGAAARVVLRGKCGTWRHRPSFCVAGVALFDIQAASESISLKYDLVTHRQLCHAQSFTHLSLTLSLSLSRSHTCSFIAHNFVKHNSFAHNFFTHLSHTHNVVTHSFVTHTTLSPTSLSHTHNLSPTTLSHTIFRTHLSHMQLLSLSLTTLSHTQLCHTHNSFTHNFTQLCHRQSFTHNFVTRNLSRTTLSHTHNLSHTQLCHRQSFTHNPSLTTFHTELSHTQLSHTQLLT